MISEICGISTRQIFNLKKPFAALNRKKNTLTFTTLGKNPCVVWFRAFPQTINTASDIIYGTKYSRMDQAKFVEDSL